jgi:rod shape-determining protein MreB
MKKLLNRFYQMFSNDIGIDLGTANTLVYVHGHGIVVNEPSIVAVNHKTSRIVAVGNEAKNMLGRAPSHIEVVRPLVDGVISDFEVTEEMLSYLIKRAESVSKKFFRPRVVVGVPSGITNVEHRAVYDATRNAGAREVYVIEEPMATAIGIRLPVMEPIGSMVIDIGGGTTDIAVISLGGIVQSRNLKAAGDRLNNDITAYLRREFKILVGEKTAEDVKINVGSALPLDEALEMQIKGRDLITGLPREIIITDADIREAMTPAIDLLISGVKEVLETTPPEVLSDVMQRGVFVGGGGALIRGLDELLHQEFKLPVYIADDPLSSVARGAGIVLEDLEYYSPVLIKDSDELPPR